MAELLIMAADTGSTDPVGKWYGANIVVAMEDGHQWGREEGPPVFYILKVPGVSKADVEEYLAEWRHDPTYTVMNSQLAQDAYRVKMSTTAVSVSGKGAITLSQVRNFFERWNCSVVSSTANSVTFDVSIYGVLTSSAFWDADVSGITFSETEYNRTTGSHLIEVVTTAITPEQIQQKCQERGVAYVAPRSFLAPRKVARAMMQDEIADRFRGIGIARRRWYITAAGMAAIQAAGGILTVTPQQFVTNLRDGIAD